MADDKPPGKMAARVAALRGRYPAIDRVMRVHDHYTDVHGGVLASSATYFAFLSFFPILALAFAVVGYVSTSFPDARDSLVTAIEQMFPGIVSEEGGNGTISLEQIENARATVGLLGFLGVLYSGLGWVSGLRTALTDAFAVPPHRTRNFVVGKAFDLITLAILGVILILSVGVAGVITGWASEILDFVNLDDTAAGDPLIWTVGVVLGVAFSTLLFFVMYRMLGNPQVPGRSLWEGALVAAIGFEVLKLLVVYVLGRLGHTPFAPLAIAITLVVWINYFSKLAMYGACWAMTSRRTLDAAARRQVDRDRDLPLVGDDTAAPAGGASSQAAADGSEEHAAAAAGRLDAGSAVLGAAAGFVVAKLLQRGRSRAS